MKERRKQTGKQTRQKSLKPVGTLHVSGILEIGAHFASDTMSHGGAQNTTACPNGGRQWQPLPRHCQRPGWQWHRCHVSLRSHRHAR